MRPARSVRSLLGCGDLRGHGSSNQSRDLSSQRSDTPRSKSNRSASSSCSSSRFVRGVRRSLRSCCPAVVASCSMALLASAACSSAATPDSDSISAAAARCPPCPRCVFPLSVASTTSRQLGDDAALSALLASAALIPRSKTDQRSANGGPIRKQGGRRPATSEAAVRWATIPVTLFPAAARRASTVSQHAARAIGGAPGRSQHSRSAWLSSLQSCFPPSSPLLSPLPSSDPRARPSLSLDLSSFPPPSRESSRRVMFANKHLFADDGEVDVDDRGNAEYQRARPMNEGGASSVTVHSDRAQSGSSQRPGFDRPPTYDRAPSNLAASLGGGSANLEHLPATPTPESQCRGTQNQETLELSRACLRSCMHAWSCDPNASRA